MVASELSRPENLAFPIKARLASGQHKRMDLQELEDIMADARTMQILLDMPPNDESCPRLQAARVNCRRIMECCERLGICPLLHIYCHCILATQHFTLEGTWQGLL